MALPSGIRDREYKKFVEDISGNVAVQVLAGAGGMQFMGRQSTGGFEYLGFKEYGSTAWYIMRRNLSDDSAWAYAYSVDSSNDWSTAWGAPASESYGDPPDE